MAGEKVTTIPKLLKDASHRQYLPGDQLGSGGFATCWRTRVVDRREAPEAEECALKAVKSVLPKNIAWRFKLELAIQSKLHHPNVVELYRAFTVQDVTYVALELCPNGSLTDMIKKRKFLTMGEIRRMLIQLCGAVKYLHERDVVHRDIKAGNIFLDEDMNVKLGDFGLAAIMEPGDIAAEYARRTTFCGTPNYLAPEILCKESGHGISVDIWAIGVLAYYLAVGKAPFSAKTKEEIYEKLRKGNYSWPELAPEQNEIPEDLRNLVASLLVEESKRPTPDQVVRHQFFTHGFIPLKLDPLCKTRRPRFARVGTMQENARIYEALCRSSHVGMVGNTEPSKVKRKKSKSIAIALAEEYSRGIRLAIPLKEGVVYLGQRPAITTTIFEDNVECQQGIMPDTKLNIPQLGVLAERGLNKGTKMPMLDQKKVLLGVEVDLLPNKEYKAPILPVVSDARRSPRKDEKQHTQENRQKIEDSVVFVSTRPASSHLQLVERKIIPSVALPQEAHVQRLVEAAQSKSKTDNPGSYRLKVESKMSIQAPEISLRTATDRLKPDAAEVPPLAIIARPSQSTPTKSPKPLHKRIYGNCETYERPSSLIVTNKQHQSPRQEHNHLRPSMAPLVSTKAERRHHPASNTQITTGAQLECMKPCRTDTAIVSSTNFDPPRRVTSISAPISRQAPAPLSPAPSSTATRRVPAQPHIQCNSSATLAAAAAAAAAAMINSRTTNNVTTSQDPVSGPLRRARTLGRSRTTKPNQVFESLAPETQAEQNPTTTLTRASTLRAPRRPARGLRGRELSQEDDEKVMAGVEREIAEMLKLTAPGPSKTLTSAPVTSKPPPLPTTTTVAAATTTTITTTVPPSSAPIHIEDLTRTHRLIRRAASTRTISKATPVTTSTPQDGTTAAVSGSNSAAAAAVIAAVDGAVNANGNINGNGNEKGLARTVRTSARPRRAGVNYGCGMVVGVGE